jgi:Protein kinase domain
MSDSSESTSFVAPDPAELATLFPGYEIEGLIATGGMGAVYCAVQKSLDRAVAIKILPLELSENATFRTGFEAEAKAMARLNHPNLIGVYDFGEVNGMLYIVMEFVPGRSIYHSADGAAIDPTEVIRLISGICSGLAHAHENGIIHRDIKPSNILLDLSAQPKIGDFGLARPFNASHSEGEDIFGTPHYTAPEVVETPFSVDYRADIFSVGVMLHELLTGGLPVVDPRPPSAIVNCDSRFDAIVRRATQTHPANRYTSATEMAHELLEILRPPAPSIPKTTESAVPRAVSPRRVPVQAHKKTQSSMGSTVLVMLFLGGAVGAYLYLSKPPKPLTNAPVIVIPPPNPPAQIPTVEDPLKLLANKPTPEPVEKAPLISEPETPEVIPEPEPELEANPSPPPVVDTPETPAPKYDVSEFLTRAQKAMKERAKPIYTKHDQRLKDNIVSLRRDLDRAIRKYGFYRDTFEADLQELEESWRADGNRIPATLDTRISRIPNCKKLHTEHLTSQEELDQLLNAELTKLAQVYLSGIISQSDRLKIAKDTGAVALIEIEIERAKASNDYFIELIKP